MYMYIYIYIYIRYMYYIYIYVGTHIYSQYIRAAASQIPNINSVVNETPQFGTHVGVLANVPGCQPQACCALQTRGARHRMHLYIYIYVYIDVNHALANYLTD